VSILLRRPCVRWLSEPLKRVSWTEGRGEATIERGGAWLAPYHDAIFGLPREVGVTTGRVCRDGQVEEVVEPRLLNRLVLTGHSQPLRAGGSKTNTTTALGPEQRRPLRVLGPHF
jgi:hypothetical protein